MITAANTKEKLPPEIQRQPAHPTSHRRERHGHYIPDGVSSQDTTRTKRKEGNTMNTIAKKMTLDEIKTLPRGSVMWAEFNDRTDEGIVWYSLDPVVVCEPGENGCLIGGNKDSFIDRNIDNHLLDDLTIWSSEPEKEQLSGITQKVYDDLEGEG